MEMILSVGHNYADSGVLPRGQRPPRELRADSPPLLFHGRAGGYFSVYGDQTERIAG